MKTLTIRFIGSSDVVSHLIEWTTNSLWCHTEALSRDGQCWVGAHAGTGVQARPLNWCKDTTRQAVYALPVSYDEYERAMTWLASKVGEPYDYKAIVGLALHNRVGYSDQELICSAFMTEWLMTAGLQPLNCLEHYSYLITPETLHLSPLFIGKRVK